MKKAFKTTSKILLVLLILFVAFLIVMTIGNQIMLKKDKETWRGFTGKFAENVENETIVELDCGHYVHDFEYERISTYMTEFIDNLNG